MTETGHTRVQECVSHFKVQVHVLSLCGGVVGISVSMSNVYSAVWVAAV